MNAAAPTPIPVDTLMARIRAEVARRRGPAHAHNAEDTALEGRYMATPSALATLPLPNLPKPQFVPAERFRLPDFLALHDEDFIDAVYLGILKRPADTLGRAHYLESLRSGRLSKVEIIGRLRYAPEGRRKKIPVRGLASAFAFQHAYRLPVLGSLIAFFIALIRLPRLAKTLQGIEGYQHLRNNQLESAIKNLAITAASNQRTLNRSVDDNTNYAQGAVNTIKTRIRELTERADTAAEHFVEFAGRVTDSGQQTDLKLKELIDWKELAQADFDSRFKNTNERVNEVEAGQRLHENRLASVESLKQTIDQQLLDAISLSQQTSAQLAATLHDAFGTLEQRVEGLGTALRTANDQAQNSRLRVVERVARLEGRVHEQGLRGGQIPLAPAAPLDATDVAASAPTESRFDRLYVAFEQRFRGTREDIRQRLAYYLPLLRESAVGSDGAAVLDIGCGRGEWLELLREENISARGVDINIGMAQACVERGLDVHIGDAIEYLKQLPDNALGAISGFHIIEHISLDLFLELIEQAYRVLQPGGIVIFETPNPENVVVGACNFYIDPTHQRPLPPVLSQFLVESGGFIDVAIHRVNADLLPQFFVEPDENDAPALRTALTYLRSVFQSAPDYSVVGRVA